MSHCSVIIWMLPKLPCFLSRMLPWFHSACFFCFIWWPAQPKPQHHPTFSIESSANSNCLQKIAPVPGWVKAELYTHRCPFKHYQIAVYVLSYFLLVFFLSSRIFPTSGSLWQGFLYSISIPFKKHANTSPEKEQMKQNCILIFQDPPELPSCKSLSSELTAVSLWSLCVMCARCSRVICSLWGWPFHISALSSAPLSHIQLNMMVQGFSTSHCSCATSLLPSNQDVVIALRSALRLWRCGLYCARFWWIN